MQHQLFLDLLIDKCRVAPQVYTHSALRGREDEAVARWMISNLCECIAAQTIGRGAMRWAARTDRVFAYWERDEQENAVFDCNYGVQKHIQVKVSRASQGYLLEILDFLSGSAFPRAGAIVGEMRPAGSGRIRIYTVVPSLDRSTGRVRWETRQ